MSRGVLAGLFNWQQGPLGVLAWLDETLLDVEEGRCWVDLGRPERARPRLMKIVLDPQAASRDRVLYGAAPARAHLDANHVDQACAELDDMAPHLPGTSSRRCREMVESVHNALVDRPLTYRQRQHLERVALAIGQNRTGLEHGARST